MDIHPPQSITGGLRVLDYGYAYDAVDELGWLETSPMSGQ
jgi:hypothetical protein